MNTSNKEISDWIKEKKKKGLAGPNGKYIKLLNKEIKMSIGTLRHIGVETNDSATRIHITVDSTNVYTFFTKDGKYQLGDFWFEMDWELDEMFFEVIEQLIEQRIKPAFIELYEQGRIKKLPDSIPYNKKVNLDKLTKEIFIDKFHEIADEYSNQETLEDVTMEKINGSVIIYFSVDCGRMGVHRDNEIRINDKGMVNLYSFPELLEGGDLDGRLKKYFEEFLVE